MSWVEVSDDLLEESRQLNATLERALAAMPSVLTVAPAVARAHRAEGKGIFPAPVRLAEGRNRTIPGPAGDIRLRMFLPENVDGVYLHLHGGGWVLGGAEQQDPL